MRGKQIAKTLICFLLSTMLFCGTGTVVFAEQFINGSIVSNTSERGQNDSVSRSESGRSLNPNMLAETVLASNPSSAALPNALPPQEPPASHTKVFSYDNDMLFSGIYNSNSYFFNVEAYWKVVYAYASVQFSISPLIENIPASLTFFVNSTPVSSCKVDYSNGKTQITYVEIPVSLLRKGYNQFTISAYVRAYNDDGCLDDFSGANWVNVSKDSVVQIGYDVADEGSVLSQYPYPFVSSLDETGSDCSVYVSADASDEELTAALLLRADLGDETQTADEISLKTVDQYGSDGAKQRVVIALKDKLPSSLSGLLRTDGRSLEDYAYVCETSDAEGNILVITSDNPAALYDGAAMLMDENRVSQEKKSFAYVKAGSADAVIQNSTLSDLVLNQYTVEDMTGGGLSFVGPFRREQKIYLPFSGGFVLADGGKADLNFRYSDNLDFDRSMVTVYWGDIPLCSKKLERQYAGGDTLSFIMPPDVAGTYAGSITIAFDLELEDLYCTKRAEEMPWAYVTGDSSFYLPVGQNSRYSLNAHPYPFQMLGLFQNTYVVVPDSMDEIELNALGEIISMEGVGVSPYGSLQAVRASEFDAEHTDANLIVFGTYQNNSVLASLNDHLSFAFEQDGSRFAGNQELLLSEDYAEDIGILQLLRSPYFSGRAILAVCGTNEKNLATIGSYLTEQMNRGALTGDAFLIDSDFETKSFTFLTNEKKNQVSLRETLEENRDAIAFTLVSTFAMLLLLLAVILVILRARRRKDQPK
jgi:cellulose synthase operon protein B